MPNPRTLGSRLVSDTSGVVYAEYVIVLMLVGLLVAAAVLWLGVPLLESFRMSRAFLGAPIP